MTPNANEKCLRFVVVLLPACRREKMRTIEWLILVGDKVGDSDIEYRAGFIGQYFFLSYKKIRTPQIPVASIKY